MTSADMATVWRSMYWSRMSISSNGTAFFCGSKSLRLLENVAKQAVANLAIAFRHALHQLFGTDDVFAKIDRGYPEANDLAAQTAGDVDRIDVVAARLGHGLSLLVERPARGHHTVVGRSAARAHGAEQGRLKPSAVLVAAFEIKIGGPGIAGLVVDQSQIAGAGLEPHVENIGLALEGGSAAVRTLGAGGKNRVGFGRVPGVGAGAREKLCYFAH